MQILSGVPPWAYLAGGTALGWVRNFWSQVYNKTIGQATRRIMVSVTIEEVDHAEAWVWLQFWAEKRLHERRIATVLLRRVADPNEGSGELSSAPFKPSGYELIPDYGTYHFRWNNRWLVFNSGKEEQQTTTPNQQSMMTMFARRKLTVTVWGTRDRTLLLDIIAEARKEWEDAHPAALQYFYHRYSYWRSRPMAARPSHTVYLPDGLIDDVLADARQFLKNKENYEPMGIPWRRGYLFYGPPGTGKSTLVQCMATELGLPLYYLSLAALKSREDLSSLLDEVRPGGILLIEDVDCITAAVERMNSDKDDDGVVAATPATKQSEITPSDLLNYIDGIIASQGRILVMTTNYPKRLDRALVRAGRVDRKWEITYAQRKEIVRFYDLAYKAGMTQLGVEEFLRLLPEPATIADAQALLFSGREDDLERFPVDAEVVSSGR